MEQILYEDKKVKITNREIIFGEHHVHLAAIREIEIRQITDKDRGHRIFSYIFAWEFFCFLLTLTPIPIFIIFFVAVSGMWWWGRQIYEYALVAELQKSEEIVFSTFSKTYAEKIAQILADGLGVKIHMK
jgi:hypothetical protein